MRTSSSGQEFGQSEAEPVVLQLFVAGNNPRSHNTIMRMRQFCEQHLEGRYQLDVIDIYQQRSLARSAQIIATPTLVKYSPPPKKTWVGDLSNTERILASLDLPPPGGNPTDLKMSAQRSTSRKKQPQTTTEAFEQAIHKPKKANYLLRLYVAGNTPKSNQAIMNMRKICEERLQGRYQLEVVDIQQQPELARGDQIIAVPTLIKKLPVPLRRMIGDLSESERVIVGLDLREVE